MNLHEYQGKQLFAEYGLPVSKGYAVDTPRRPTRLAAVSAATSGSSRPRCMPVAVVRPVV